MDDFVEIITVLPIIFIGLPWLILHYVTKWKQAPKITVEDERVLDEMYNLARRLEERLNTVERIVSADNPDWRPGLAANLAAPAADPTAELLARRDYLDRELDRPVGRRTDGRNA